LRERDLPICSNEEEDMKDKKLFNKCERMWKEIVKLRAGYKSELSGIPVNPAHPHHIKGKSSYALRFDTRGGICISSAEHYKAHATDNYDIQTQMREYLMKREGEDILYKLELQRNRTGTKLEYIAMELEQELERLKMLEN
jgi:hypothetical protein